MRIAGHGRLFLRVARWKCELAKFSDLTFLIAGFHLKPQKKEFLHPKFSNYTSVNENKSVKYVKYTKFHSFLLFFALNSIISRRDTISLNWPKFTLFSRRDFIVCLHQTEDKCVSLFLGFLRDARNWYEWYIPLIPIFAFPRNPKKKQRNAFIFQMHLQESQTSIVDLTFQGEKKTKASS